MRAAILVQAKKPLQIRDVDMPKIGRSEVLVKVKACGICHSDLHFIEGLRPTGKIPIILGHEAAGVIEEVGEDVYGYCKGDRVAIDYYFTCGVCSYCRTGLENLCQRIVRFGMDVDGAYAEYTKVPYRSLCKIPSNISFEEAAVCTDAVATPYHALKDIGVLKMNEVVALYGIGGLGINAVQIAHTFGAKIIAVDVSLKKLDLAKQFGADFVIDAKAEDPVKEILELTNGEGVDLALEFIGLPDTIIQTIKSVKKGGRAVIVGLSVREVQLNSIDLVVRELSLKGSRGLLLRNLEEVLELVKYGKIKVKPIISDVYSLEEINNGIRNLREGSTIRSLVKLS